MNPLRTQVPWLPMAPHRSPEGLKNKDSRAEIDWRTSYALIPKMILRNGLLSFVGERNIMTIIVMDAVQEREPAIADVTDITTS